MRLSSKNELTASDFGGTGGGGRMTSVPNSALVGPAVENGSTVVQPETVGFPWTPSMWSRTGPEFLT